MSTTINIHGSSNDTDLVLASSGGSIVENGSSNLVPLTAVRADGKYTGTDRFRRAYLSSLLSLDSYAVQNGQVMGTSVPKFSSTGDVISWSDQIQEDLLEKLEGKHTIGMMAMFTTNPYQNVAQAAKLVPLLVAAANTHPLFASEPLVVLAEDHLATLATKGSIPKNAACVRNLMDLLDSGSIVIGPPSSDEVMSILPTMDERFLRNDHTRNAYLPLIANDPRIFADSSIQNMFTTRASETAVFSELARQLASSSNESILIIDLGWSSDPLSGHPIITDENDPTRMGGMLDQARVFASAFGGTTHPIYFNGEALDGVVDAQGVFQENIVYDASTSVYTTPQGTVFGTMLPNGKVVAPDGSDVGVNRGRAHLHDVKTQLHAAAAAHPEAPVVVFVARSQNFVHVHGDFDASLPDHQIMATAAHVIRDWDVSNALYIAGDHTLTDIPTGATQLVESMPNGIGEFLQFVARAEIDLNAVYPFGGQPFQVNTGLLTMHLFDATMIAILTTALAATRGGYPNQYVLPLLTGSETPRNHGFDQPEALLIELLDEVEQGTEHVRYSPLTFANMLGRTTGGEAVTERLTMQTYDGTQWV